MRKFTNTSLIFSLLFYIATAYAQKNSIEVTGSLFNQLIKTSVDCELAKLMLSQSDDSSVVDLFDSYKNQPLNTQTLADIYFDYSADVATLYFLQRIYQYPQNKEIQDSYYHYINQLNNNNPNNLLTCLKQYYIVFIPGFAYKDFPSTGANFKRQRKLLTSYDIDNCLIKTKQWDAVEVNAEIIAEQLKTICQHHYNIILISASKGSLETAVAISELLDKQESENIKAWISVAGILRGSPIADYFLTPSKSSLSKFFLFTKGKRINTLQSMSYRERRKTFDNFTFPQHIKIIHYLAAPLASQIRHKIKNRYNYMLPLGPNDGIMPLADQICGKSFIISELGCDHYFKHPDIDVKSLSILLCCVKSIEN